MDISELIFNQKNGVFFVWKMGNGKMITTFLRERKNIALELQIENAFADGRMRLWSLVGAGYWFLCPVQTTQTVNAGTGIPLTVSHVTASLLRFRNLPPREMQSTVDGEMEMRKKWIPYICAQLRQILWEDEKY